VLFILFRWRARGADAIGPHVERARALLLPTFLVDFRPIVALDTSASNWNSRSSDRLTRRLSQRAALLCAARFLGRTVKAAL
jgi:hypothetical protein